jgi:aminoglycoside phosphotransferase (APT) family kinase protein
MRNIWDAEIAVEDSLVSRLLTEQFPLLGLPHLEVLGVGWDNVAYLVNHQYVFRFPRRHIAVRLLERETRILPLLVAALPLRIPAPEFVGQPDSFYPYPFTGYRMISGTTACRVDWTDESRIQNAVEIAGFLAALHRIPIDDKTREWAPGDDISRTDLEKRFEVMKERVAQLEGEAFLHDQKVVLVETAEALSQTPPWIGQTCWVHGDLYARHLLVDEATRVNGVIDWGDVHLGDPALDLSIAFSFLPPQGRALFREAYGFIDDATWERAKFRALHYGVILLAYGQSVEDHAIANAGAYALQNALK